MGSRRRGSGAITKVGLVVGGRAVKLSLRYEVVGGLAEERSLRQGRL